MCLTDHHCCSVSLSRASTQAAAGAVLACCFLNLHHWSHGRSSAAQPHRRAFSAAHLLRRAREEPCMAAKLDCLLNYFQRLRAKSPAGLLSFTRKVRVCAGNGAARGVT